MDIARKYVELALGEINAGNLDKAEKFLLKAEGTYPTDKARKLLARVRESIEASRLNRKHTFRDQTARKRRNTSSFTEIQYTTEQLEEVRRINNSSDFYQILEVSENASISEITKAYKKLSLKVHPDKNAAPQSEEAFKKIGASKKCLTDVNKRKSYDRRRQTAKVNDFDKNRGHRSHYARPSQESNAGSSRQSRGNSAGRQSNGNNTGTNRQSGGNNAGPSRASSGNNAGPSQASSGNNAGPSRASSGNNTGPSRASSGNNSGTGYNTGTKRTFNGNAGEQSGANNTGTNHDYGKRNAGTSRESAYNAGTRREFNGSNDGKSRERNSNAGTGRQSNGTNTGSRGNYDGSNTGAYSQSSDHSTGRNRRYGEDGTEMLRSKLLVEKSLKILEFAFTDQESSVGSRIAMGAFGLLAMFMGIQQGLTEERST